VPIPGKLTKGAIPLGLSSVSDVTEDGRIAWCSEPCSEMVVTSLADGEETVYPRPEDELHRYGTAAARFSDDGRYLAAPAGNDVMLIDTVTGEMRPTMTCPDQTAPHLYVADLGGASRTSRFRIRS